MVPTVADWHPHFRSRDRRDNAICLTEFLVSAVLLALRYADASFSNPPTLSANADFLIISI
jgi:hypothetical protein